MSTSLGSQPARMPSGNNIRPAMLVSTHLNLLPLGARRDQTWSIRIATDARFRFRRGRVPRARQASGP